jgi:peroxiredoxin
MNRKIVLRLLLLAVAVVALGIVLWGVLTPRKATVTAHSTSRSHVVGLQVGNMAPDFTLVTSDEKKIHLHDFRGQPVVILFSSTDCKSCQMQVSDTQRVYVSQLTAHKSFTMLGIDLDDTAATIMHYDMQTHIAFPVLLTQSAKVGELYQVTGTPTSVFIDRDGVIRAGVEGEMDSTTLQRYLAQVSE